jgi:hypothetical protein
VTGIEAEHMRHSACEHDSNSHRRIHLLLVQTYFWSSSKGLAPRSFEFPRKKVIKMDCYRRGGREPEVSVDQK